MLKSNLNLNANWRFQLFRWICEIGFITDETDEHPNCFISYNIRRLKKHHLQHVSSKPFNPNALCFDYKLSFEDGSTQDLEGLNVYDNGRCTFFSFSSITKREETCLFVVSDQGQAQPIEATYKGSTAIINRLFERAELRLVETNAVIARITKLPN